MFRYILKVICGDHLCFLELYLMIIHFLRVMCGVLLCFQVTYIDQPCFEIYLW